LSQRRVATQVGVSRGTVHAIARGKRVERVHAFREDELGWRDAPPERCPRCGALVYMPCLACRVRELVAARRPSRRVG
jgi:hypothetical protein